ncbi:MAG: YHYH protein [Gammaproteobacteria bacterium]|nr:YHYH protein [Gammaproteobacteria bacterium]MBT8104772.1 YHYH protein [Gammaproteobacteria bacterium]NNK24786.1 YHYH protein [Woeseiaceae bacterium]
MPSRLSPRRPSNEQGSPYPSGIYHYFVTDDYPFIQRCVWGEPTDDALLGPP